MAESSKITENELQAKRLKDIEKTKEDIARKKQQIFETESEEDDRIFAMERNLQQLRESCKTDPSMLLLLDEKEELIAELKNAKAKFKEDFENSTRKEIEKLDSEADDIKFEMKRGEN